MAESNYSKAVTLEAPFNDFKLVEEVHYPNGGSSSFYEYASVALIVDDDICEQNADGSIFDYSLITSKQNEYVSKNKKVYRFLREDIQKAKSFLDPSQPINVNTTETSSDRANLASASPLEMAFEEHFINVYGSDSARYLWKEYSITDLEGHTRFLDYFVQTKEGPLAVEENGVNYHHPQIIGKERYREQLLKQNSCEYAGIKLYRFSSEDCKFTERFEDDIKAYFGQTSDSFIDAGLLANRKVELYEHQEGALEEMTARRKQGIRCFLAVFPTASGKSKIVEEDIARFASSCLNFKALIAVPTTTLVNDWKKRLSDAVPQYQNSILVCTYNFINRHCFEYDPAYFKYIVIDEAHHAVAPTLKRTIQYFNPDFLVGLTATDKRPDKKNLEAVFGSYRVGLSLPEAMEKGIIARANAFRIETNIDLSKVRINGKDYVNADLEKSIRVTSRNELIVDVIREYFSEGEAGKRQGVVFCVNIKHAEEMARLLNEAGISAKAVSGKTKNLSSVMQDFRKGDIRFLCSCQLISEGWDYPELGILVMARPTLSRVLYVQQLGRGLRKTSTKKNVFVIDVVDEYGAMVTPCSLHSIFQNPFYVPFGDILRRDYKPGDWIEVDGLHERIERITEIDTLSFSEKYESYLSVEQVARQFFVSTGTINSWISKKKITPSVSFQFGNKKVHLFSPDDVTQIQKDLNISVHDDSTIKEDFFAFLEERDYSLSYKMPFLLSFIKHMDRITGSASIEAVLDDYIKFYLNRAEKGLVIDRNTCSYNVENLKDRKFIKQSMLRNPFEKFERKRFLYYSKDLGMICINHALQIKLTDRDYETIVQQMKNDLKEYYSKLG